MSGYDRWTYGDDDVWDSVREVAKGIGITSLLVGGVEIMEPGAVPPENPTGPAIVTGTLIMPREIQERRTGGTMRRVMNTLFNREDTTND